MERMWERGLVSMWVVPGRRGWRVLFVEPWWMRKGCFWAWRVRIRVAMCETASAWEGDMGAFEEGEDV